MNPYLGRILLVDDDEKVRNFYTATFTRAGYTSIAVSDLASMREALSKNSKLLRSQQVAAPMIAFSAGSEQQQHIDKAGFACFISKPVERATLVDKIRDLLNRSNET